ncbi:thrombospondin type 3 repeat-containing protein [Myxococcota bacterium]|nr:thrombospondin type 3 repeat-containing protein [Myxococcota bacterium]
MGPVGDADADGIPDERDNCPGRDNPSQRDADADGTGDACDADDTDRDGIPDGEDLCPLLDVRPVDADGDGVGDQCDVCPAVADRDQADADGDGTGDACEIPDQDEDGVLDADDNCPRAPNVDQADADEDGVGDPCDDCPAAPDFSQRDRDEDGIGDACDPCPDAPRVGDDHDDLDRDGTPACAGDCADDDAFVRPGVPETCNGVDDDCTGRADDAWPEVGAECRVGQGACERLGAFYCLDAGTTACSAQPGRPVAESCNDVDDDCDGQIDEGLVGCCEPEETQACGADVGLCRAGVQVCRADRSWGPCDGRGPSDEVCNGADDDCDGQTDDGLGVVTCGVGRCAHPVASCEAGAPGFCDPMAGAAPETCNAQDDDCDGRIDDGFDLLTDEANCGRCGQRCDAGVECRNGSCGGRDTVLLCGRADRDVSTFLRGPAAGLRLVAGCAPDARTRAVLVTRTGIDEPTYDGVALQTFVINGGAVVGENGVSMKLVEDIVGAAVFFAGPLNGPCMDEPLPPRRMHLEDPVWTALGAAAGPREAEAGCGYPLDAETLSWFGFVPLGGWTPHEVSLGYIDFGAGRIWLVEADWHDVDRPQFTAGSLDLMAHMIAGWVQVVLPQCQNGFDDDLDGRFDVNDTGCDSPGDETEGDAPIGPAGQCVDGRDNDANGLADFPFDPGCRAAGDATEARPAAVPLCANGRDDDADGFIDFPADPGCAGAGDTTETQEGRTLACGDGYSHDGRSPVDYPGDPDCQAYTDDDESPDDFAPVGIMRDLDVGLLSDWRICHQDGYDDSAITVAQLLAACNGDEVLLGCRPVGAERLQVAAGGARAEVFRDVGAGRVASTVHNGVQFYFDELSSIGFAPVGATIDRNSCDYLATSEWQGGIGGADDATTPERMCWHTNAGRLSSGFRCGGDVIFDGTFERVVYTR